MVSTASQVHLAKIVDDSVLMKGPDLHNLKPGNIVGFQDWYSLHQKERDQIQADLQVRGLTLLPFDEQQFHVTCYDTSRTPAPAISTDPLPQLVSVEDPLIPESPDFTLTPPDSIKLTVIVSGGPEPTSPVAIPGAVTSGMQRELATHIAIELNRSVMRCNVPEHWHMVASGKGLTGKGFCVVRILLPKGWLPRSEYDTPPSADCGMMNAAARMEAIRFNRLQLACGGQVKFWQLHIKPLEYPKAASRVDLNELESEVIATAAEGLAGQLHVNRSRNGELSLQFNGELNSVRWVPEKETPAELARQFRRIAQRFLEAAKRLDGREQAPNGVTLHAIQSNERLIRISGFDDVHLLVENARSDEAAFARAREAMSRIAG
ncbi:hypothetical protein SH661x_001057 [Planctomicrobium sp. SH661]|uniref:hypothetical protein n=1 Tax=Planctomicrobium sp. SH661 TaxID=3448124 RepID=UPI003F5B06AA